MSSVGWAFFNNDEEALLDFKAPTELYPRACYWDYYTEYDKDKILYINMETYNWYLDLITTIEFKNIKFILVKGKTSYEYKKVGVDEWGDAISKKVKSSNISGLFKIEVSNKYSQLNKYIVTYLAANILRMGSLEEGYPKLLKYDGGDKLQYIVDLNTKCQNAGWHINTNHIITTRLNQLNKEVLLFIDDPDKMNKLFLEKEEIKNDWIVKSYYVIGFKPSQTGLVHTIYTKLQEKNNG